MHPSKWNGLGLNSSWNIPEVRAVLFAASSGSRLVPLHRCTCHWLATPDYLCHWSRRGDLGVQMESKEGLHFDCSLFCTCRIRLYVSSKRQSIPRPELLIANCSCWWADQWVQQGNGTIIRKIQSPACCYKSQYLLPARSNHSGSRSLVFGTKWKKEKRAIAAPYGIELLNCTACAGRWKTLIYERDSIASVFPNTSERNCCGVLYFIFAKLNNVMYLNLYKLR